jgi:hypothetical protein
MQGDSALTAHNHWLTSVADKEDRSAQEYILELLDSGWYLFGEKTGGRNKLQQGDEICFYVKGLGVVAAATVESAATHPVPAHLQPYSYGKHHWAFRVRDSIYFFQNPVILNKVVCGTLEAFKGRDLSNPRSWVWFVQGTHRISSNDFKVLSRCRG